MHRPKSHRSQRDEGSTHPQLPADQHAIGTGPQQSARSKQRRRDRLIAASTTSPRRASMATGRMVTSSRRAGRITNKSRLLVYRGSDKVDLSAAETIVWNNDSASESANKHNSLGAKGVESGELLVSLRLLFTFLYACGGRLDCRSPSKRP